MTQCLALSSISTDKNSLPTSYYLEKDEQYKTKQVELFKSDRVDASMLIDRNPRFLGKKRQSGRQDTNNFTLYRKTYQYTMNNVTTLEKERMALPGVQKLNVVLIFV